MSKIALNYIYLSKNHAGGKDQVGLNLLKGFYEQGLSKDMVVICFDYSVEVILKIAPDIKVIELKCGMKLKNELQRMMYICWVNTKVIPRVIKENNIDLIYHLSCNNGFKRNECINVVIPHDIKAVAHRVLANVKIPLYKYYLYKLMYYLDFKHADYIIAISDTDKNEISQYYERFKEKIVRIYNPIVIEPEDIKDKEVQSPYICAVNLQFHHKNIITLIKAIELLGDNLNYKLMLIGNVPKRVEYLKTYVREHGLENKIEFTGFVNEETMKELFQNSALYVNPTLYEGFGMTAIEAMIYKIPTLVSKIPTNFEITRGLCNYYFPPEDENVLSEEILRCLMRKYTEQELNSISEEIYNTYNYLEISKQYYNFFMSKIK